MKKREKKDKERQGEKEEREKERESGGEPVYSATESNAKII